MGDGLGELEAGEGGPSTVSSANAFASSDLRGLQGVLEWAKADGGDAGVIIVSSSAARSNVFAACLDAAEAKQGIFVNEAREH
jgi:hypothetical protein